MQFSFKQRVFGALYTVASIAWGLISTRTEEQDFTAANIAANSALSAVVLGAAAATAFGAKQLLTSDKANAFGNAVLDTTSSVLSWGYNKLPSKADVTTGISSAVSRVTSCCRRPKAD